MLNGFSPSKIAWCIAAGCAIVLLFAPLGGRTARIGEIGATRDGPGYDWVVLFAGMLALVALLIRRPARASAAGPSSGILVAFVAFAVATWAAGSSALALVRDGFPFGRARLLPGGEVVVAAAGPPIFAAIAAVGLACCAGLVAVSLRPGPDGR